MNLRLKANEREDLLWLPCEERVLQNFCYQMDIANTAQTKVEVIELYIDEKLSEILLNKNVKLDELNFFFKLYEGMSDREKQIFYAVADAKNPETMKELINLTANTNCYHLVDNFSNLKELGRNLYLNEQGGVYESVLREFNAQKYVENILSQQTPLISKYGLIYTNENTEQQIMKTDCFPSYWYKPCPILLKRNPYLSILGYLKGENSNTHPPYTHLQVEEMIDSLKEIAAVIIFDCTSSLDNTLTTTAILNSDFMLNVINCDLKSISFLSSQLSTLYDKGFDEDIKYNILSNVKGGQNSAQMAKSVSKIAFELEHSSEVEEQNLNGDLFEDLTYKNSRNFRKEIKSIINEIIEV